MPDKTHKNNKRKKENFVLSRLLRFSPLTCVAVFIAAVVILLGCVCHDYLRKVEEMSFFASGSWFFNICMSEPGGFINWLSTFLTQFFYHPLLGAFVFAFMLVGLWYLTAKTFRLPSAVFPVGAVPSAMLLLFILLPGYLLYMSKTPGFAYTGVVGFAVSVAMAAVYSVSSNTVLRLIQLILFAALYPLFGFYALFGILLGAIFELTHKRVWWLACVALVLIAVIPQIYFYCFESHAMLARIYVAGLPRMSVDTTSVMLPFWIIIGFYVLAAALSGKTDYITKHPTLAVAVSTVVFALALVSVFVFRYKDRNFEAIIGMELALNDGDNDKAIKIAENLDEEHTRVVDLFTHIALFREGRAGDRLFTFPLSDAPYNSPYPALALRMSAAHCLNYYFGRLNDCYRWCMEDMVEYGYKTEYLKYMVRCALMNGEYDLARRYLRLLSGTMFHKAWAKKYLEYADNPELMKNDSEFMSLEPLTAFNSRIGGDSGLIEYYISMSIAGLRGGPPPLVELSLQFNMVQKNIADFWPRFMLYARSHDKLPVHYQEAALLFSTLEKKVDWHQFNIEPEIAERFSRFMQMARENGQYSQEHNRTLFEPLFGDTYWYYYFFVNLKTT